MEKIQIDNHYKYGLICDDTIKLFNTSTLSFSALTDDALEDVDVHIDELGILYIKAKVIDYDLYIEHKAWEEDWLSEPDPKLIKTGKKYPWSNKPKRYVNGGWVRTTKRFDRTYVMNNYKIEIFD